MFDLFGNSGLSEVLPDHLKTSRPVKVLEESIESGRLAHAMLLHGENLEDLETVAQALASVLLETQEKVTSHPDYFTLRPAKKARQIRIGDKNNVEPNTMRWLLKDLQQSSHQGGRKIAVVYEADRMNQATANAFLKTLEEPPEDTIILLLTTRPYDLLDTIRSRCFNFRIPCAEVIVQDESWQNWIQDYKYWLEKLYNKPGNASERNELLLMVYGLTSRFSSILKKITALIWEKEKKELPDTLSDDELDALETGFKKGQRKQLFANIEKATRDFAIKQEIIPSNALAKAIETLEKISLMNDVFNLKEDAALEYFLLSSLRNWPIAK